MHDDNPCTKRAMNIPVINKCLSSMRLSVPNARKLMPIRNIPSEINLRLPKSYIMAPMVGLQRTTATE